MEKVEHLVIGAGITGLAYANAVLGRGRVLVIEREAEAGGYCRTVVKQGYTWDYSGHFFHFQRPEIDQWMRARMPPGSVRSIAKKTRVRPLPDDPARETGFPFQTRTHELPPDEYLACLADLRVAAASHDEGATSFQGMLERRYGKAICQKFLVPYNEKLYATDLDRLDVDAMGRFFPHPRGGSALADALEAAGDAADASYNATFTYPTGGAVEYVHALLRDLPPGTVALGETLEHIDVVAKVARTSKREIAFDRLVTSAPLPSVLAACGIAHDAAAFTSNQVLVFNLGFDKKGRDDVHWIYFADKTLAFYRVGFYDNILGGERMSLYVELGMPAGAPIDVDKVRARVLADLERAHIVSAAHELLAWHHVVMKPAYVHVTKRSLAESARCRALLADHGVHAIGRYGGWTYCSIEDDIVEARALAAAVR